MFGTSTEVESFLSGCSWVVDGFCRVVEIATVMQSSVVLSSVKIEPDWFVFLKAVLELDII